jgi:hypothetical protein
MGKTSMVNWFARNIRVKVARPSDAVLPPSWARLQAFAGMVHDVIEAAADEPQLIVCDDLVQATLVAQYISIATTSPPNFIVTNLLIVVATCNVNGANSLLSLLGDESQGLVFTVDKRGDFDKRNASFVEHLMNDGRLSKIWTSKLQMLRESMDV